MSLRCCTGRHPTATRSITDIWSGVTDLHPDGVHTVTQRDYAYLIVLEESETASTASAAGHMLFTSQPGPRTTLKSILHHRRHVCRDDTSTIVWELNFPPAALPQLGNMCVTRSSDNARFLSQPPTSWPTHLNSRLCRYTEIRAAEASCNATFAILTSAGTGVSNYHSIVTGKDHSWSLVSTERLPANSTTSAWRGA